MSLVLKYIPSYTMFQIDFDSLNYQELVDLRDKITLELNKRLYSTDKYPGLTFVSISDEIPGAWLCYEQGTTCRVNWMWQGKPLSIDYIEHSSKHTSTTTLIVRFNGQEWYTSHGTYETANTVNITFSFERLVLEILTTAGKPIDFNSISELLITLIDDDGIDDIIDDILQDIQDIQDD